MNAAYLAFFVLGLIKAAIFIAIVRWCLKNDLAAEGPSDDGNGGEPVDPSSPYTPPNGGKRAKWKVLQRRRQAVQ